MQNSAKQFKNIVLCCDGTGNMFGSENSNVVKLYTCLEVGKDAVSGKEQIAYYHPGVGTMGSPNRTSKLGKESSRVAGLVFAAGFTANLADAYVYLMNHYEDGDHIYLFGFSRGAYTVRALAGALYMYGLLCPGNEGHLPYLLNMFSAESRRAYKYRKQQGGRKVQETVESKAFRETFSRVVPIHFIGIWDTVSSIGWIYDPVKVLFDAQNPIMRKGRHAVSVDERRCFYQANLWGPALPPYETPVLRECSEEENPRQDILQAWFAGVHSDVGGSYLQCESGPAMQAFRWILDEAEADGLHVHSAKRNAIFGVHSAKYQALSKLNSPADPPESCVHHSLRRWWWLLEFFPHKYFDQNGELRWRLMPWPHRREIPDGALLHPSLLERIADDATYRPENLRLDRIQGYGAPPAALAGWDTVEPPPPQFGVYRHAEAPARRQAARAGATALIALGVAALLLRRLT